MPEYGSFPSTPTFIFYSLVLTLSNGRLKHAANAPAIQLDSRNVTFLGPKYLTNTYFA